MTAPTEPTTTTDPAGATPPATTTEPAPTDPPANGANSQPAAAGDKPLGPNGEKALQQERETRKALEKQLGELAGLDLGALKRLAGALGGKPDGETKTDLERVTERISELEKTAGDERTARYRAEVAAEKGLTAQQAGRLVGATREEIAADADALLALFPAASGTPKPDPSQGTKGSASQMSLDDQIKEAQAKSDWRTVLRLQNQKFRENTKK